MANETLRLIASRRSHRAYAPTPLTQDQLDAILQSALASPSAVNRQPWHFTVVSNQALLNEVDAAMKEEMMKLDPAQRSRRLEDENFQVFYHAPVVIFISGMPDYHYTPLDGGIAVQNMALAAESLGLGSVILGMPKAAFQGPHGPELRKKLKFPEGWDYVIAIAIGVPTDDKPAHPVEENKISFVE